MAALTLMTMVMRIGRIIDMSASPAIVPDSPVTNHQRFEFMQKLSADVFGPNGLRLEDWEQRFVSSWRASSRPTLWFIGERPRWTDALWRKYGSEIKFPFPLSLSRQTTPAADKDCCMFLVRDDDRRLKPCNEPATKYGRNGFLYCDSHGEQAQKSIARGGGHMELRTYLPKK